MDAGEVHISSTEESTSVHYFDSDHGSFAIRVDDCNVEREVE